MGETICAICCGTGREVTIDCPQHCPYLVAAHRYEADLPKSTQPAEIPFPNVQVPAAVIQEHELLALELCAILARFAAKHPVIADADVLAVLSALAETTRTAAAGIYYEKRPDGSLRRDLYAELADVLLKIKENEHAQYHRANDSEVFQIVVFLARLASQHGNGRPKSKAFLGFLRRQFPPVDEIAPPEPRLIIP
jgi:hypothetical protein